MPLEVKKAIGRQGWWFATIDDEALPCVHVHWRVGKDGYHDPFKRHEGKNLQHRIQEAVDAMASGRKVILTDDKATLDKDGEVVAFERARYIGVFEIDNLTYSPADGLRFRFAKRLYNLKP